MALTAAQAAADHAAAMDRVGETVSIRRYSGLGASRSYADVSARARIVGYDPHTLTGSVLQGDRKVIVLAADLEDGGLSGTVTTDDKIVVRGKELDIIAADDSTRRLAGTLIAYELQVRG